MRHSVRTLLLSSAAALAFGLSTPAIAQQAPVQIEEANRYQIRLMSQIFDGSKEFSHTQVAAFARTRKGDESWVMLDFGDGAVVIETTDGTSASGFTNTSSAEFGFAYNYTTQTLSGDNNISNFHNLYVRPLLGQGPKLGESGTWTATLTLAQLGFEGLGEASLNIELERKYFTRGGKDWVLLHYKIPSFTYTASGARVVQWGEGVALTDPGFGHMYWSATLIRAAGGQAGATTRPYRYAKTMAALDDAGKAMVDIRTMPEVAPYMARFYGHAGTEVLSFEEGGSGTQIPVDVAAKLDIMALSLGENSANQLGELSGAYSGGNRGDEKPTSPFGNTGTTRVLPPTTPTGLSARGSAQGGGIFAAPAQTTIIANEVTQQSTGARNGNNASPPPPMEQSSGEGRMTPVEATATPSRNGGSSVSAGGGGGPAGGGSGGGGSGGGAQRPAAGSDAAFNEALQRQMNNGGQSRPATGSEAAFNEALQRQMNNGGQARPATGTDAAFNEALQRQMNNGGQARPATGSEAAFNEALQRQMNNGGQSRPATGSDAAFNEALNNQYRYSPPPPPPPPVVNIRPEPGSAGYSADLSPNYPTVPAAGGSTTPRGANTPTTPRPTGTPTRPAAGSPGYNAALRPNYPTAPPPPNRQTSSGTGASAGRAANQSPPAPVTPIGASSGSRVGSGAAARAAALARSQQAAADAIARRNAQRAADEARRNARRDADDNWLEDAENLAYTYDNLDGIVETDLSKWAEWLATQDVRRLTRLAKQAGYPSLASALADAANILRLSQDPGYRQWARTQPSCAGYAGCGPSFLERWAMKSSIVALGDILNDSRSIFSTAGLSDIGIRGTSLAYILRDFGIQDGDVVNITIKQFGKVIYSNKNFSLTTAGDRFTLALRSGVASLEIFAVNEGTSPPNTAEITVSNVTQGEATQSYSLNTGETATLRIVTNAPGGN